MNNYPSWWNQTVTVYNRFEDPQTRQVTWYRKVISNCFWKYTGNKVTVGSTTLETDTTVCRIPKSTAFMEKHLWNALSSANKANYFTLGPHDILVLGTVTDAVNEYTAGTRSSDLLKKYKDLQGCMVIEKCSLNVDGDRGNEHYYVRGI